MTQPRIAAALAKPPKILSVVAVTWLVAIVIIHSDAGVSLLGFFLWLSGGLGLAVLGLIRYALYRVARRSASSLARVGVGWWTMAVACLLVGIACGFLPAAPHNPLFRVRFNLSESALTSHAERLTLTPVSDLAEQRVGLFRAVRIESRDDQVRFITTDCAVVDSCGLVYSPRQSPQRWQEDIFVHIRGPWWHVFEGF